MQYKKLSLLFPLLFLSYQLLSQNNYKEIDFLSPVDFPIYLSGNFGEIRAAHFHSGIDIKTQGVSGKKIYAVDNGYISRIKISVNSYGKTIYINHPNGYTTVYGHLSKFNSNIDKIAKEIQYQNNDYEINYFPKENELPVKRGEVIAYSGNTGSSEGPHLHFEVRETNNQIPVNPLFFNFNIKDNIPPVFYSLVVYPINNYSKVNSQQKPVHLKLDRVNGYYSKVDTNKLFLSGEIGFGIEMNDFLNNSRNKCGIHTLSLYVDNILIYKHSLNKFSFYETGYVKSHVDYAEKIRTKKTIQKMFIAPNNNLSIYESHINKGVYSFNKDTIYNIKLVATDVKGNKSELLLNAVGQLPDFSATYNSDSIENNIMKWEVENIFENDEIKIVIPKSSLFDSINFKYSKSIPDFEAYSDIHHIHNMYTPLNKSYSISIRTKNIPEDLYDKVFIAELLEDGEINSIGGEIINENIVSESKNFGDFVVLLDTISPQIKLLTDFKNINDDKIDFFISDNLSDIKSFNGYIDNNWALFEYDKKNDLLFYIIDNERIVKNTEHELELFVIDNKNNVSTFYTTFYW